MELWIGIAIAAVVLVLVVTIVLVVARRSIRQLQDRVDEAWRDVQAQRRRRAETVPALVHEFRAIAPQEHAADDVDRRLAADVEDASPSSAGAAEDAFQTAFRQLLRAAEGYPQLQTSAAFLRGQGDLAAVEEELQRSRRFYNGGVRELNAKTAAFPGRLVAGGVERREYFEVDAASAVAQPPKIEF